MSREPNGTPGTEMWAVITRDGRAMYVSHERGDCVYVADEMRGDHVERVMVTILLTSAPPDGAR